MKIRRQLATRLLLWIALFFSIGTSSSLAQLNITIDTLDTSQFPEIRIVFRVFDGTSAVQNLTIANFTVFENGMIQGPIDGGCDDSLFFTPSSILLILDRSSSISQAFPAVRQAAKEFINNSAPEDEFAIFSFGGRGVPPFCFTKDISIESSWTSNKAALLNAIDGIADPCGGTPLYESIVEGSNFFQGRTKKRIMVVLTDGDDSNSGTGFTSTAATNAALSNNVTMYTIGLGDDLTEQTLITMASQTGGKYFRAPTAQQLSEIYEDISSDLAPTGNCEITYTTLLDCFDGSTVNIELQVRSGSSTASATTSFQLPYDTTTFTYVGLTAERDYIVEAGQDMVFPLTLKRVSTNRTSNNYEVDVNFNKSLLELVEVETTPVTAGYSATFQETPTGATVTLSGGPAIVDTGDIALLHFHAFDALESSKSEIGISEPRTGTTCTIASANNGLITINGFCRRLLTSTGEQQEETRILPNTPNPFNPGTSVSYIVGKDGKTTLKVFDAIGREVATLVNDELPAGEYGAYFDASGLSNGVYYLHLENNGDTATRRIVLVK